MSKNRRSEFNKRRGEIYREIHKNNRERIRLASQSSTSINLSGVSEADFEGTINNVQAFSNILESLAAFGNLIFLDSNILTGGNFKVNYSKRGECNLLRLYGRAIYFAGKYHTIEPCLKVIEIMRDVVLFYDSFLQKPDVHIISGVCEEQLSYIREQKRNIRSFTVKHGFDSALKKPLKELDNLISRNMQITASLGYEDDPVTREIFDILNKGKYHEETNPSETDKMLVAIACASSCITGRNVDILTNDKDISSLLQVKREDIKDLARSRYPSGMSVEVKSIRFDEREYYSTRHTGILLKSCVEVYNIPIS